MVAKTLNLLFPQWHGGVIPNNLYNGAYQIYNAYNKNYPFEIIDVQADDSIELAHDILGYDHVLEHLKKACDLIERSNPDKMRTFGGDCSVDLGPISFLNKKYDGDFQVIWLDAHGDLNTPKSSPSNNFHGMPVRKLLGDGHDEIVKQLFSTLSSDQFLMAGIRDLDAPEQAYVDESQINVFTAQHIKNQPNCLEEFFNKSRYSNLHVHLDLDILDPNEFSHIKCPVENGLSRSLLLSELQRLKDLKNIVGFTLTEFSPNDDTGISFVKEIIDLNLIGE